ncbi:MAG: thioredoxin domain-containing protein [Nostocoides sp.]
MAKPKTKAAANARQAKIDAARKASQAGPNKIIIGSVVAVIAIIAVVAGVIINSESTKSAINQGGKALPPGVTAMGQGWVENASVAKAGVPTLSIYEDFRCPVCQGLEQAFGNAIETAAEAGTIKLVYHFKTVIDSNLGSNSSQTAASNALCAAEAGAFWKYHDALYANQPAEGTLFTDVEFLSFAEQAGITGPKLTTFQACVKAGKYLNYVKSTEDASFKNGITGTPAIFLNGKPVAWSKFQTAAGAPDTAGFAAMLTSGTVPADKVDTTLAKAKDVS